MLVKLIETLDDFADWLDHVHDQYWQAKIAGFADSLRQSNPHTAQSTAILEDTRRELFEIGYGSLYDLIISEANGHIVDDEDRANQQLQEFTDRISREIALALN